MIYVFTEMIMTTGCMRRERMSTEREVGKKSASSTNFDLLIVFMESFVNISFNVKHFTEKPPHFMLLRNF